jgi:hypothetical protein
MTTEAHVINLADRTDRWEAMKIAWKDEPITLVRRDAIRINGTDIPDAYHAVFLKHREMLTEAKAKGEKHILIMEDDAAPCKDFARHWTVIKEYLDAREDWELFNGGMLMIRDCVDKIIRIDHKDKKDPTMVLGVWRGAMAHFLYMKVEPCLAKMAEWEADGKPMFDGWYSHKMKTFASIPYLAFQRDGYSDAAGETRSWEDRFAYEEDMMKYALREFLAPNAVNPQIDHADPRQTVLREIDRTSGGFEPPKSAKWNGKAYSHFTE